ncbi:MULTISPECIES: NAD(P)-dependent oxidoreductase [unclassified Micromonospora]|uniref:NAD-dependent epimerase/dehydratase family protein n=1 Tax=unclassified Micromonospora TaxID=2617518 RepID=UPI00112E87BD|nr:MULTISPECIES: NAD(P)-dependent oxidoreductase [unclassified Micromonospora]MCK1804644.1 NAD(P)-dependent oxidoreductase [Micromonospora sp. R42106]MCK1830248.1 NAD(P)-dependent oxidoreductase [Micromonospora sp. R42003]MCK1841881.1 NAD(P)-dependent oxidoreductase [Micromonospora sp. R42004]
MTGDRPRAVVLGGTGFVGAHVADAFVDAGHDVLTVARRAPAGHRHRFTALDLGDTGPGTLARLLDAEDPVAVVDSTGSSWGLDPGRMAERCTRLSALLLDALRRAACRPRLVHLGSVLEYGQPVAPADPRRTPAPDTAYGRAKLAATRAVLAAADAGEVDAVVLRLVNALGPGLPATSLLGRVAAALAPAARAGVAARVTLAPLEARRDFVDVRDAAEAVLAAAGRPVTGRVLDIGRGEAVPVRTLVRLLVQVSGVQATVVERAGPAGWRAGTRWSCVDPAPAAAALGWRPRRDLRRAVTDFWHDELRRYSGDGEPAAAGPPRQRAP